jgi:hypothetical protein
LSREGPQRPFSRKDLAGRVERDGHLEDHASSFELTLALIGGARAVNPNSVCWRLAMSIFALVILTGSTDLAFLYIGA